MKHKDRPRRLLGMAAAAAFALLTSACVGIATPDGWPALSPTDNGLVVTQVSSGHVAALDPTDGSQVWLFPDELPGGTIDPEDGDVDLGSTYATPVIDGDRVYLVSYDGLAVGIEMDGDRIELAWQTPLDDEVVATPVLNGDQLYVATDTGAVIVLNTNTGTIEQRYDVSDGRIWGRPVLDGNVIYLSDLDERATIAVDVTSGDTLWETGLTAASPADLVLDGDLLIVGSFDSALHALDVSAEGEERWRFKGDGWFVGPPAIEGDTLYAATMRGTVYALDRQGNELWSHSFEDEEVRASPLLFDGVVMVATRDGMLAGFDPATGDLLWESIVEDAQINAHGLQLASSVYYITRDHELLRVDASTGAVQRFSVTR